MNSIRDETDGVGHIIQGAEDVFDSFFIIGQEPDEIRGGFELGHYKEAVRGAADQS